MQDETQQESGSGDDRRTFLDHTATGAMATGLAAGYGLFACHAFRFLYPSRDELTWQFVCTLDELKPGEALNFTTPAGAKVVVARQDEGDTEDSFIALSSVCPHLGCKVHWEPLNHRFFCPCHNGAFDSSGAPTEGPVAAANQHLTRFPLTVQGNLLMIQIPTESVQVDEEPGPA